ncbi:hypothetical protein BDR26DRAFT_1005219 [Obelidium mucronatum]|nr:hypothetical protein BDR26DRAFT_1005219 [Obelidium mucronatum]
MDRFKQEVERLIANAEAELVRYEKHQSDYANLARFLADAPLTTTRAHRIPVGKVAFMEGRLVHTNEVLVSLGDNYFVDRSCAQALEIVHRRQTLAAENTGAKQDELKQLKMRLDFVESEKRQVDADGDEVNEDGLKFVEIREEEDNNGNIILDQKALKTSEDKGTSKNSTAKQATRREFTNGSSISTAKLISPKSTAVKETKDKSKNGTQLGAFELNLLKKLELLEKEEDGIATDTADEDVGYSRGSENGSDDGDEYDSANGADEYEKGLQEFSSGLREDDDDDDFNDGLVVTDPLSQKDNSDDGDSEEELESIGGSSDEERETIDKPKKHVVKTQSKYKPLTSNRSPESKAVSSFNQASGNSGITNSKIPPINNPGDIYTRMKYVSEVAVMKSGSDGSGKTHPPTTTPDITPPSTLPESSIFLQDNIIERSNSDNESIGSEDIEDFLLGREIAKEYHERRQVLLAQQVKIVEKMGDDVKERLEIAEEERTESLFRSQRIGFQSESMENEIREYIESQKREDEIAREEFALSQKSIPLKSSLSSSNASGNSSKPRFKPVVKPKKSVSFSEEALDVESEQQKSVYNFQSVSPSAPSASSPIATETHSAPSPVAPEAPRVSKFKASRQAASSASSVVAETPSVPSPVTPEIPRVSKFKASRQVTSSAISVAAPEKLSQGISIIPESVKPIQKPNGLADQPSKAVKSLVMEKSMADSFQSNGNTKDVLSAEVTVHHRPVAEFVHERSAPTQQPLRNNEDWADDHVVVKKKSIFRSMREGVE